MTQHYTSNTLTASKWCNKCKRETQHSVSGHIIGHCLACQERQANHQHLRDYFQVERRVVEIDPPCQCRAYPFAHYHSDRSATARSGRWEAHRRGHLR